MASVQKGKAKTIRLKDGTYRISPPISAEDRAAGVSRHMLYVRFPQPVVRGVLHLSPIKPKNRSAK
jgi:hypothetical protein